VPVASILGISLYELFGLDDPMMQYSKQEQRVFAKYKELNEPHRAAVSTMIDMLGDAELKTVTADDIPDLTVLRYFNRQLAAGIGDPTDMDDDGEPIYLYSTELIDKADYVFTVNGESMEPVYNSGDMVLVEKCTEIEYGQVGAFLIGNEAYIKECREDGLHSYNEKYKTMKFNDDDSVSVIGKVIGVITAEDIASQKDIRAYQLANDEA
jgi:SOS-response transcriptional repressor LexA